MWKLGKMAMVSALALSFTSTAVKAQDKTAYVNLMAVLEGTAEGKATVAKLKKEGKAKEDEFKQRMSVLQAKYQQFQSRAKMMKEEKAAAQMQQLQKEEQELKILAMQYQNEFQKKQADALSQFQQKVANVIEAVAKREGVRWVFRQEVLLYGPPGMDLTSQVIREYDKRFKTKGGSRKKGK